MAVCTCGNGNTLGDVDPRCPVHFPSNAFHCGACGGGELRNEPYTCEPCLEWFRTHLRARKPARDAAKVYCPQCEQPIERPVISNPVVASVGSALAGAAVVYVAFSCPNCHTALSFAIVSSKAPGAPRAF